MQAISDQITAWILAELAILPKEIKTIYIEWNQTHYGPKKVCATMNVFGFSKYDDDLGDFDYEGDKEIGFDIAEFPDVDWAEQLQEAASNPEVLNTIKARNLSFMVAEHDCEVITIN